MTQKIYEMNDENIDKLRAEYEEGQRILLKNLKIMVDMMQAGHSMDEIMTSIEDMPYYLKLMLYEYLEDYLQRESEDGQNN